MTSENSRLGLYLAKVEGLKVVPMPLRIDEADKLDEEAEEEAYGIGGLSIFDLDRIREKLRDVMGRGFSNPNHE